MIHKTPIQLRLCDTDQMGHVNNAVYLSFLELARVEWFQIYFPLEKPEDFNFILARAEIDYKKPITLGDIIEVWIWVTRIGNSSWEFEYKIVSEKDNEIIFAHAKSVQVTYNYESKKSMPLPDNLKTILQKAIET